VDIASVLRSHRMQLNVRNPLVTTTRPTATNYPQSMNES